MFQGQLIYSLKWIKTKKTSYIHIRFCYMYNFLKLIKMQLFGLLRSFH